MRIKFGFQMFHSLLNPYIQWVSSFFYVIVQIFTRYFICYFRIKLLPILIVVFFYQFFTNKKLENVLTGEEIFNKVTGMNFTGEGEYFLSQVKLSTIHLFVIVYMIFNIWTYRSKSLLKRNKTTQTWPRTKRTKLRKNTILIITLRDQRFSKTRK